MAPSYFLVPDEKIDYAPFVQLGNVLYRPTQPDLVLSTTSPGDLDGPASVKTFSGGYSFAKEAHKSHKYGLFAKILDFFGFGVNVSHAAATENSETYTAENMTMSRFVPTQTFLSDISSRPAVQDVLQNSGDRCVFLITGVAVVTGLKFEARGSSETDIDGSLGLSAGGVAVGPQGKRSKKMVLRRSYADKGPTVLGFAVQKLELKSGDGVVRAEDYTTGAYFGDDIGDEEKSGAGLVEYDADVNAYDTAGLEGLVVEDEVVGEDCVLYLPD
ncbi:hypothetical protein B0H66DRAFT_567743 [Apodospora peruviana]|uniref:Uncharacterized protein n=1 Tax=Apodospora peruviana TaxID=516989 RepID=A0AAE0HWL2_9PEZI|nr:hypothetical protein B0H66DRAFT_567743 [Apodospora peruviana]